MQTHRRQITRRLSEHEKRSLQKVQAAEPIAWSVRLTLEEFGLIRCAPGSNALTPAGREALRRGWVTLDRM